MSTEVAGSPSPAERQPAPDVRVPVAVLSILALLQAAVVLVSGGGIVTGSIAVGLAIAGIFVRLPILSVFAALIVVNFGAHLAAVTPPFPYRVAHVFVLTMYGAVLLAALTARIRRGRFGVAFAACASLAGAFVVMEAVIERVVPPLVLGQARVREIGDQQPYAILRTLYPDNPRGYFDQTSPTPRGSSTNESSVTYSLNALGCRGADYAIPRPAGRRRVLVLGNSSAFGAGVKEPDTFTAHLERLLNQTSQRPADKMYEVINCGLEGSSTREQRLFYEQIAFRYAPDVVLAAVSARDNLSRRDEQRLGYAHQSGTYERLLLSARLVQYARHEGRRPFDYSSVAAELAALNEDCRARDQRLAVVLFGSADLSSHWNDLVKTVSTKFMGTPVPVLDLGLALIKEHSARELTVHPLDANPNEIAHRIAAEEIARFLTQARLTE